MGLNWWKRTDVNQWAREAVFEPVAPSTEREEVGYRTVAEYKGPAQPLTLSVSTRADGELPNAPSGERGVPETDLRFWCQPRTDTGISPDEVGSPWNGELLIEYGSGGVSRRVIADIVPGSYAVPPCTFLRARVKVFNESDDAQGPLASTRYAIGVAVVPGFDAGITSELTATAFINLTTAFDTYTARIGCVAGARYFDFDWVSGALGVSGGANPSLTLTTYRPSLAPSSRGFEVAARNPFIGQQYPPRPRIDILRTHSEDILDFFAIDQTGGNNLQGRGFWVRQYLEL